MIQFASKNMISDLKSIWKVCFGDKDSYIDFYFEHRFEKNHILVWKEEDRIVSMIHLFPTQLVSKEKFIEIMYVYGVATMPQWRGKGLAKKLLNYAKEYFSVPLLLVPASHSLFQYYAKLGYQTSFWLKEVSIERKEWNPNIFSEIVFQQVDTRHAYQRYQEVRDHAYLPAFLSVATIGEYNQTIQYVQWDESMIYYALLEHEKTGGIIIQAIQEHHRSYVLCRKEKELLIIKEIVMEELLEQNIEDLVYQLLLWIDCQRSKLRLPSHLQFKYEKQVAFAMLSQDLKIEKGYFNLALDEC